MSNGVEFDFDNEPRAVVQDKTPAIVKLVIKLSGGLIKDSTQANYVLLGFVVLVVVLSFFLWTKETSNELTPQQLEVYIQNMNNIPLR